MEPKDLEPTEAEVELLKQQHNELTEQRKRNAFTEVKETCPRCDHYPLEEQSFGYERSIFCSACSYMRTETM